MIHKNIVCPVCGAACDDIQVEIKNGKIEAKNVCKMGISRFNEITSPRRFKQPLLKFGGKLRPVSWDGALQIAADILFSAKRPLISIGSETSCEAHEVGLMIGEYLGAIVDTIGNGATVMGTQEAGKVGATEGQKKNRADLLVYWGTNPLESMPRQMSRYGVFPRGYWTKRGRFDRTIITVDPRKTLTAKASDLHVQLKPDSDYELISALLTLLHGKTPHHSIEKITGVPVSVMEEMLNMMKNCNFGTISVGVGLSSSPGKYRNIEIAMNLVKELNKYSKFTIGVIRSNCNAAGFNQVASYMYGYPFGLDFMRGHPRYNPGEFTTVDLLREKDVDAAFIICADLLSQVPPDCAAYLKEIPLICLDTIPCPTTSISDIVLPGVVDSMECEGTFYRLDDVPIYFEPFLDSPFKFTQSNEDTLKQLFEIIKGKQNQDSIYQDSIFPVTYIDDPKTQNCSSGSQISSVQ
ncbi:formylmethanofuran dehydrogenase subunit B [Methanosarcina vacuolata]|uniref:Formylmethanofuran dehydrogenase (Molybdenum) subunit B n=1 Tax=Methanosarcina vacuolata Z-761 TaxID=1434123 RepID=A0A0E3Q7Q6_9EURY|nr:formylmethanofuran dehydrogenase subunit B [Methanosarcina vacuolata]AKB44982.1 Formylmethanofuran dehydrogenase (molybdenum) subunit B [Methanosarcina vacuolata Z-761]